MTTENPNTDGGGQTVKNRARPIVLDEVLKTGNERKVEKVIQKIVLNNNQMCAIRDDIFANLIKGLRKDTRDLSSIKALPTFVSRLPTGRENGEFLAVDLGGTNMRVILIKIVEGNLVQTSTKVKVPLEIMTGSGEDLFGFIAEAVEKFLHDNGSLDTLIHMGFTCSFPITQTGIANGILVRWTKGFTCADVVNRDVCVLLAEEFRKRKLAVQIDALLNDTTGCLVSVAWKDPRCCIGVVVGTGCNACYIEQTKTMDFAETTDDETMILNTEWGTFGDGGELNHIKTEWDEEVDRFSPNTGQQTFEKMVSGLYMGELVRCVLLDLANQNLVFKKLINIQRLSVTGAFPTKFICEAEADPLGTFDRCRSALKEMFGINADIRDSDCIVTRMVCERVTRRACILLAAGLSAIVKRNGKNDITIGVDGTLFRCHPMFYLRTKEKMIKLLGADCKFDIAFSEDGSGLGAALVAAAYSKQMEHSGSIDHINKSVEFS